MTEPSKKIARYMNRFYQLAVDSPGGVTRSDFYQLVGGRKYEIDEAIHRLIKADLLYSSRRQGKHKKVTMHHASGTPIIEQNLVSRVAWRGR